MPIDPPTLDDHEPGRDAGMLPAAQAQRGRPVGAWLPPPTSWSDALTEGLATGAIAGVLSAAAAAALGWRDSGSAVAPINAVSHWLWGDDAGEVEVLDAPHTAVGAATHVLSAVFWATLHAKVRPRGSTSSVSTALAGGLATSAVAAAVDYGLAPRRITPGWELRVSTGSMVGIFAALAAGIAIGTVVADRRG